MDYKYNAPLVISIDAMSGDFGAAPVIGGIARFIAHEQNVRFLLHGDPKHLAPLLLKAPAVSQVCDIIPADKIINMNVRPSVAMRNSDGTSLGSALDTVKKGNAAACISCGNTGALMAVSMLKLRKLPGINRPAIACLWPSTNAQGYNVLLDVGADITATAEDLLQFALMGAAYAKNGIRLTRPRLGLLNVGTEEHKGSGILHKASALLDEASTSSTFDYIGFVEANDIPSNRVDVIVTDGFTGNVALKSAEGTARFIRNALTKSFKKNIFTRIAAILAYTSMSRFAKRIDPRNANGAVFLGLNGLVVKAHGSSDAKGFEAAIRLVTRLQQTDFDENLGTLTDQRDIVAKTSQSFIANITKNS